MESKTFSYTKNFPTELGEKLPGFDLFYTTYGTLNREEGNVIWVCHALTGNSFVEDWWDGLFGKGKFFDSEKYFIVCANILGGCNGSTGPLSINPETNKKYHHDFPALTIRDMAKAFDLLRKHLEIDQIELLIGASLGGQHALEWTIMEPKVVKNLVCMATNGKRSPWSIALNESQRMAIRLDPSWKEFDDNAGLEGMKVARTIALISYRGYDIYKTSQAETDDERTDDFKASSYQRYQGDKLAGRFNAFTYMLLTNAMDSHNIARGRDSLEKALARIEANCLFVGIRSDLLFPYQEQAALSAMVRNSRVELLDSRYGHDGFLVEVEKIEAILKGFLEN